MSLHRLHGVTMWSELPLTRDPDEGAAELSVAVGPPGSIGREAPAGDLLVSYSLGDELVYSAARREDGVHCLRIHGLCDFELDPGLVQARCLPDVDADLGQVALVARGAFLAFWLGLRGQCTLHASAVDYEGSGVVFVGGSGMGKSTLAGWACAAGALFVSDDLVRLNTSGMPHWVGQSPELRLRPGAAELVEGRARDWGQQQSADDRVAVVPPRSPDDEGPVSAVVVPVPAREARGLALERLDPLDATFVLSRFPRLEGWKAPEAVETQLDGAARLAGQVPVLVATIPWGPPFPPPTMLQLLEDVVWQAATPVTRSP